MSEADRAYKNGWNKGFAAGLACALVVALGAVFVVLAFDTFFTPPTSTAGRRP